MFVESYREALKRNQSLFAHEKTILNRVGINILESISSTLANSATRELLKYMALANSVDVWMPGRERSGLTLEGEVIIEPYAVSRVESANDIGILLDNSGEGIIDIAVALILASRGKRVTLFTRTEPYELDILEKEVKDLLGTVKRILGLDSDLTVVGTGSSYPPSFPNKQSDELLEYMKQQDVIISKGIANFEAFLENCPADPSRIIVVLRAKCKPVSRYFSVPSDHGVAAVLRCRH